MDMLDRVIGEYKIRRIGNSNVITIPKSMDFRPGETIILRSNESGTKGSFEKKTSGNPWENGQFDDFDFREDMKIVGNYGMGKDVGRENAKWD
ncbi:hypothetical protein [uncultured Lacticaseibacillus sp.]|uniref:hypothetical protein n=1 Tax=uncultured Lacticaseibacillus sp. TaxID=2775882 RepID=UPI002594CFAF|nr:hypothetical protein [uncultured Lacticaseibacillus sp.]